MLDRCADTYHRLIVDGGDLKGRELGSERSHGGDGGRNQGLCALKCARPEHGTEPTSAGVLILPARSHARPGTANFAIWEIKISRVSQLKQRPGKIQKTIHERLTYRKQSRDNDLHDSNDSYIHRQVRKILRRAKTARLDSRW